MLAAINLLKSNYIVTNKYEIPSADVYGYELTQKSIFEKQMDNMNNKNVVNVLNSSLFIDVDLFGKSLYFHSRGKRLFNEDKLKEILKHY